MGERYLVIFIKEPRMGQVKTRLAEGLTGGMTGGLAGGLGVVGATAFYRNETRALVRRLGRDPRWRTVLAVTPDKGSFEPSFPDILPPEHVRIPQGPGDLGARMSRVFETLPPGPALIIGSDIPEIECSHIEAAFKALGASGAVVGPSGDGGYWLIGQRRTPRVIPMFSGVRWSTEFALGDTLASMPTGTDVARLQTLNDIDTIEDYRRLQMR